MAARASRTGTLAAVLAAGLLAIALGALTAASGPRHYSDASGCHLPDSMSITQEVDLSGGTGQDGKTTITAVLPVGSRAGEILAGAEVPTVERLGTLACLFGEATVPDKVTREGQTVKASRTVDYIAFRVLSSPEVTGEGLRLTVDPRTVANPYEYSPSLPAGSEVTLRVRPGSHEVRFTRPPTSQDATAASWTWRISSREEDREGAGPLSVVVPLGLGERVTTWLRYQSDWTWSSHWPTQSYDRERYLYVAVRWVVLAGWAGEVLLLVTLARTAWRRVHGVSVRWRLLTVAVLLPFLPMIASVRLSRVVQSDEWVYQTQDFPGQLALVMACLAGSALLLRRSLVAAGGMLGSRTPRGTLLLLALATLPAVAVVLAWRSLPAPGERAAPDVGLHGELSPELPPWEPSDWATVLGLPVFDAFSLGAVLVLAVLVAVVASLYTRAALQALALLGARSQSLVWPRLGTRTTTALHAIGRVGPGVVAMGALYGIAAPLGLALTALRDGASPMASPAGLAAQESADVAPYPVTFLLAPAVCAVIAYGVTQLSPRHVQAPLAVLGALAWAATSRALDLRLFAVSLPVGTLLAGLALAALVNRPAAPSTSSTSSVAEEARGELDAAAKAVAAAVLPASPWRAAWRQALGRPAPAPHNAKPQDVPPPRDWLGRGPSTVLGERLGVSLVWGAALAVVPVGYVMWGTLTSLPRTDAPGVQASIAVGQLVAEVVRWLLTAWVFGALLPQLPGRVGPAKALWLAGAWFAGSLPMVVLDQWTGAGTDRGWLFPGLQLLLYVTVLSVVVDVETMRRWPGTPPGTGAAWKAVLAAYDIDGVRRAALYAAPALAAVIAIGQQVVSGSGLEFVNSLLSGVSPLLGSK